MDFSVEVLETDLPAAVNALSCTVEALGNEEVLTQRAGLTEAGDPTLPLFKFRFKKGCTHASLTFTASGVAQEDHSAQATPREENTGSGLASNAAEEAHSSQSSVDIARGLYPLTLFNPEKIQLGSLSPSNMSKKTHLVYLCKTGHADVQSVVGKILFKIKFKTTKTFPLRRKGKTGSWLGLRSVEQEYSQLTPPKLNLEELASKESSLASDVVMISSDPTVTVIFHSVSTKISELTPQNIFSFAYIGASPKIKQNDLFTEGESSIRTLATLKLVRLKSTGEGQELGLSVGDIKENILLFSTSFPIAELKPFHQYSWEYNWRWLPGASGFNPSHSHSSQEPNVVISVTRWPSLSEHQSYEGLEVFVNGVNFENPDGKINLVLCCRLISGDEKPKEEVGKFPSGAVTVVQHSCSEEDCEEPIKAPGYFFFPGFSADQVHHLSFTLYATPPHAGPWWLSDARASGSITLSKATTRALQQTQNAKGVRWELENEAIVNSSPCSLRVVKASGLLKWKSSGSVFLSDNDAPKITDRPHLKDIELPDVSSSRPATEQSQTSASDTSLFEGLVTRAALTKLGDDILKLREENELLRKENRDYEKFVLEMEASVIVTAEEQQTLQLLTKSDLIHKVVELSERLRRETETRRTFQSKVWTLQNTLIKKNDTESRYIELQQAHVAQQKLIRELQSKVTKYKKCSETCLQQENVISQLESLLEKERAARHPKEFHLPGTPIQTPVRTRRSLKEDIAVPSTPLQTPTRRKTPSAESIQDVKYELMEAKRRYQDLEDELAQHRRSKPHSTTSSDYDKDQKSEMSVKELESKLKLALMKERALIQVLKEKTADNLKYELELADLKGRRSDQTGSQAGSGDRSSVTSIPHSIHTRSNRGSSREHPSASHNSSPQHHSRHARQHQHSSQHHSAASNLLQQHQRSAQHSSQQRPSLQRSLRSELSSINEMR